MPFEVRFKVKGVRWCLRVNCYNAINMTSKNWPKLVFRHGALRVNAIILNRKHKQRTNNIQCNVHKLMMMPPIYKKTNVHY
jgi:hypothetical protein